VKKINEKDFNTIILFRRIKYLPAMSGVIFLIISVILLIENIYPAIVASCFFIISLLCLMCSALIYVYDKIVKKYIDLKKLEN